MKMEHTDIRWKQRFQNFEKAIQHLESGVQIKEHSDLERAGVIQYFEMTFELAWKTLKDYLQAEGYDIKSPRATIKQAFQNEYIQDGKVWLEMLEKRNELTHAYNETTAEKALLKIKNEYFTPIRQIYLWLKQQL